MRLAWLWMFLVGYILITPGGPICIVCGPNAPGFIGRLAATVIGVVSIGLGIAGLLFGGKAAGRSRRR